MAPLTITPQDCGLRVLYDGTSKEESSKESSSTRSRNVIDVVAVHGMGAHPDQTWGQLRSPDLDMKVAANWINWLEDPSMLPSLLPKARIMRFGYLSAWFGETKVQARASRIGQDLLDALTAKRKRCRKRPIIFISHSFGGLVVLETLVLAKAYDKTEEYIYDRTMGLAFFGTPFRGAHNSLSQGEILRLAEQKLAADSNLDNLRLLQPDDESAEQLLTLYLRGAKSSVRPVTVCFYEQKESDVGAIVKQRGVSKAILVTKASGTFEPGESVYERGRACDHFDLHRFNSPELNDWLFFARMIRKMKSEYMDLEEMEDIWDEPESKMERTWGKVRSFFGKKPKHDVTDEDDDDDTEDSDDSSAS